jgi:CheY-like chemotaxis protein
MDIQMPEMDGYEATRRIRAEPSNAQLPIIAMTANALPTDRESSIAAGMNAHIAKPINVRELFATLARWIGGIDARAPRSDRAAADDLPVISGLDTAMGLAICGGDKDLYRSLLARFRDDYRDFAAAFDDARRSGGAHAAQRFAHGLKGTAANLGARAVAETAATLETACRDRAATAQVDGLAAELGTQLAGLHEALATIDDDGPPSAATGASGAPALDVLDRCLAIGAQTHELLAESDAGALSAATTLAELLAGTGELDALAARLLEQAQAFDFARAAATLDELMPRLRLAHAAAQRPPDDDDADALLDHLAELLADDDAAAADLLPRLRASVGLAPALLAALERQLEAFDFGAAQHTLAQLRDAARGTRRAASSVEMEP